ncbi:hypothetical protein ACFQH6_20715 [Halobacteriaceae archaeon GCM10025711]
MTLGALRTDEFALVEDHTKDVQDAKVGGRNVDGAGRKFFVAAGLLDAPFLDEDAGFEARARAVGQQPMQVTEWLEHRINELSTPDVDFRNGFGERVAAKRQEQATSPPN